ncbi:hypothetical protein CRYUN_Cryun08bG0102300 [Craigia yunnanensis]
MGWELAELINNPIVMEKARQEIDSVVAKSRILEESDVANLPYLQAIVKEILRLHPSGPFIVRESTKACVIAGYEIPADTRPMLMYGHLKGSQSSGETTLSSGQRGFLAMKSGKGRASDWM